MTQVYQTSYPRGIAVITITINHIDGILYESVKATTREQYHKNDHTETHQYHMVDGVPRWLENNWVVPVDCVREFFIGMTPGFDARKTLQERDDDTNAFHDQYREVMKNHKPSSEELSEMRSIFGEGATVVNVITGKRTKL